MAVHQRFRLRAGRASLVAVLAALGVAVPAAATDLQSSIDSTRAQIATKRAHAATLSGQVSSLSGVISKLSADISVLQRQQAALEADLSRREAQLERTRTAFVAERRRALRLAGRLRRGRAALAKRLLEIYKDGSPDVISVVMGAKSFGDLLERADFIGRVNRSTANLIDAVHAAGDRARRETIRLGILGQRQQAAAAVVAQRRNAVAANGAFLARKQAGYGQALAARRAALAAEQSGANALSSRLQSLEARLADAGTVASTAASLGKGNWAIPSYIVSCESGGRNTGPNYVGASGYYQIIPSTWKSFGGSGNAAYKAPKSEQDRVASRIYAGGSGAGNWVCAGKH